MSSRSAQQSRAVYESVLVARTEIALTQRMLVLDKIRREARTMVCRECRMAGKFSIATVAVMGIVCLCADCAEALSNLFLPTEPAIQVGRCKRCWEPITTNDNLAEQKDAIGRLSGYCTLCWNSRQVKVNFPGTPKLVRRDTPTPWEPNIARRVS